MAWASAIVVSSTSTIVTCTRTSVTPSTFTESLSLYNLSYGGYTMDTTYEPSTVQWQYGVDSGSVSVSAKQNYRIEWYSTQRDFSRGVAINASDYSLYLGSGTTISIPTIEASAHKRVYNIQGHPDDYLVYAKYIERYQITFDANGGTPATQTQRVNEDGEIGNLPTATRDGYEFVGWFTDSYSGTQVDASTIMGEDDAIVYAHWTQDTATVTFNGNGGTPDVPSASYSAGSAYGSLPSATRQYYVLIGWFTAATGGTQITPSNTATTQILYAHWQEQGDSVDGVIWNSNNTDCILENS